MGRMLVTGRVGGPGYWIYVPAPRARSRRIVKPSVPYALQPWGTGRQLVDGLTEAREGAVVLRRDRLCGQLDAQYRPLRTIDRIERFTDRSPLGIEPSRLSANAVSRADTAMPATNSRMLRQASLPKPGSRSRRT